jgi:hypothetical protein
MFRNILVLALGVALGSAAGGAQAASAIERPQAAPVIGAEVILAGHRYSRSHHGYRHHRGHAYPRYRGRGHYRPHYDYHRGYHRGYLHGRFGGYPGYGRGNAYPRGHGYDARSNYLRDMYGK